MILGRMIITAMRVRDESIFADRIDCSSGLRRRDDTIVERLRGVQSSSRLRDVDITSRIKDIGIPSSSRR